MAIYHSDLKTTRNMKTGVMRYYVKKCGIWVRISRKEYFDRESTSFDSDCYLTRILNDIVHNSKTIYIDIPTHRGQTFSL